MEPLVDARPLAEESLQMWDLNKRLEAYLARVKFLEDENEGLKAELQRSRGGPAEEPWRGKYEQELAAWRAHLDEAFREKNAAELGRASLRQEVQQTKSRSLKERAAREEAQTLLALGHRQLEEDKRSHLWLRGKAAQLEKEAEALREAHREERLRLEREVAAFSWDLEGFRGAPAALQPLEVEDYSARLAGIWRGAVQTYQAEVSQLEASFGQAKQDLCKATRSNQQNQLQLQTLQRELAGLKGRKEALEERLARQWQHQQGEAQKLQLTMEGLEEEKQALAVQIAQVLEDRRQLMHLKMSLSLEVATYRTLLEAESTRLQMPGDHTLALSLPDSKLEANRSKRPAVSVERGQLGSRDPRPSSTTFAKGGVTPPLPKSQSGPFPVSIVSVLPKSRSPVAREFQKANTVLQSQSAKASEAVDAPAFIDSAAFQFSSPQPNEVVTASKAGAVSPSFVRESPLLFSSKRPLVPKVLGDSSSIAGQSHSPGEDTDEMKIRELGEEAELCEEVEAEEGQPIEEPPWETTVPHVPYPSQLVTEAFETALQEVPLGEGRFEAGLFEMADTPNGIPSEDSSSMEDENGAAASPSPAPPEGAMLELHKSQTEAHPSAGLPEGTEGSEDSREANGGPGVCAEQQEEAGTWLSWDAVPSPRQETQLLEEERSPSAQRSQEEIMFDIPAADRVDRCHGMRTQGGLERPPPGQSILQRDELQECFKGTEPDTEAAAPLRGHLDSPEPGTGFPEDHTGANGPDVEEADGGVEDLEVVSTEALHLSEDEERRALSSPSRESEEGDFQAELLESEFPQTEESAVETLSPISHPFPPAGSHQDPPFRGVEQEAPEEETSLSTLPEEERGKLDSGPEASSAEEAALRGKRPANAWSVEPGATEEEEEEAGVEDQPAWQPQQDILGGEDLPEEEDALGKEDTVEKKEMATWQDWTWEQQAVLQQKNLEGVLRQEISIREQGEKTVEARQEDLPREQQVEDQEFPTKGDQIVEACQGDMPKEKQVVEEEITTKGGQGEETIEGCQEDLPGEQQVEEEEITTKGEQGEETVEGYQEDMPVKKQMEEEEITIKGDQGEQTVEVCQGDMSVEEQMEQEEITTKGEQTVEACQGDMSVEEQVEEEKITIKGEQTIEMCQGDMSVEEQVEEEEITIKGEQTVEACQGNLPREQQVEEEITTKGDQIVEACLEDLPREQQVEEEEITTKGEQGEETVEGYQEDMPVKKQMEEEQITIKGDQGEQTVEVCQEDMSVEEQVEEEEITIKGEQTVEVCQEDLPREQQMDEEEITIKGEQTVETCQGDMSVEEQVEEEEITTKGEQTVEACQGNLSREQQVEEEEIATKGEQTVEACQGDLPREQQVEEEEITTKEEETVEACQGDMSVQEQIEDEEITIKGEQAVEVCQEDLPREQQVEEKKITTKGEQEEERVDMPQEHPPVQQPMEEEGIPMASLERDLLKGEDLITEPEAMETVETKTSVAEKAATMGGVRKEDPEAKPVSQTDAPQAEEQPVTPEREETDQTQQQSWHFEQSLSQEASMGASEVPSEAQHNATSGSEAKSCGGLPEMALPPESGPRWPSDQSGSEVSLESFDASPNATRETEEIELELESSNPIKLEETLPDHTPLHLYDEEMLVLTGKGQLLPENGDAAEAPLWTKDGVPSAEAMERVAEEAERPASSQAENEGAKVLEGVKEQRGCYVEAAPKQEDSLHSEELPVSKNLEEAETGTLDLLGGHEGGLPARKAEVPSAGGCSPAGEAELDDQPGEILSHGSGARKALACGEVAREEAGSTGFAWEPERDHVFPSDQPSASCTQEGFPGGDDSPWGFGEPSNLVPEGSHKVSPLTSVADLGEIVLEEEQPPGGQSDGAASEGVGESGPGVHGSQPISAPDSCGGEEPAPQADWPALNSSGVEAGLPLEDSDILEIVEQALEFNQEIIKAAEPPAETEKWAAQGEAPRSPAAEDGSGSRPFPDVGRPQAPAGIPSPNGASRLWVEDDGHGPRQDSSLADFSPGILNGLGGLPSAHRGSDVDSFGEELMEEVAVSQPDDLSPLETLGQNPPETPAHEEAPRTGDGCPEIHKSDSPEHRGQEERPLEKSLFASRMRSVHGRGKGAEVEAVPGPPHFGEEILHLEPIRSLTFRPGEEEEERWPPEDN